MSLMAIILWALNAFSPWRRLYAHAHHLLQVIIRNLNDQATVNWLCANPDDPDGIPRIERCIDDLKAALDLLIYQRAREILGLRPTRWHRRRLSPPQRRRARTLSELHVRLKACILRFTDIERVAQRRAEKLARLLATDPTVSLPRAGEGPHALNAQQADSGGGPAYLIAPPFETTAPPVPHQIGHAAISDDASLPRSGEETGARCADPRAVIIIYSTRAGLRVRAPPRTRQHGKIQATGSELALLGTHPHASSATTP
jgi:hypothetical protein